MEILSTSLVLILFAISLFNFVSARSISPRDFRIESSVAILIPMRNEEINARHVVASSLAQANVSELRVMALDDFSNDQTGLILSGIRDDRFTTLSARVLPSGWLGKNFALHTLAAESDAEYLVFLDADVRLDSRAISSAISLMNEKDWDYICPYPKQIASGLLAKTVQPLLQWSWFATLPLRLVENSRRTSTVVANGQFFIVKNSAYKNSGGHEAIKGEVLDDLELARSLRKSGSRGSVVDASAISTCEMYKSSGVLIAGYSKSQWRAFGGPAGALVAIALLFITSIYPFAALVDLQTWAILSSIGLVLSRAMAAIKTRSVLITAPLHPIAISIWIYLIIRSLFLKRSGKLEWRGRTI
jgi:glycosyltransferase involved in cell wall biosynthesis